MQNRLVKFIFSSIRQKSTASSSRWINRQKFDHYTREAKIQDLRSRAGFKLMQIDDKFRLIKPEQNIVDLGFAPGAWCQVAVDRSKNGRVLGVDIIPTSAPKGASVMQGNILSATTHANIRNFFNEAEAIQKITSNPNEANDEKGIYDKEINESKIQVEIDKMCSKLDAIDIDKSDSRQMSISKFPVDLVLSDLCAPYPQETGFWNNTTNRPWSRMQNTSGLKVKDHLSSMDLCDAGLILAIDLLKKNGSYVCKFFQGKEDILLEKRLKRVFNRVIRFKPEASRSDSKEMYFVALHKRDNVIDKMEVFK